MGQKRRKRELGVSPNNRRPGASGIKKEDGEDMLVGHVRTLRKAICDLVAGRQGGNCKDMKVNEVKEAVKEEVARHIAPIMK